MAADVHSEVEGPRVVGKANGYVYVCVDRVSYGLRLVGLRFLVILGLVERDTDRRDKREVDAGGDGHVVLSVS